VNELGLPFKRYHMATVWRGENTQRGRYREFMQCDFDTIGTTSPVADLEMVLVVHDLLAAIGLERFTIRVNDRRVLAGILETLGLAGQSTGVLRSLDKLAKAGPEAVTAELAGQGVAEAAIATLLEMAGLATADGLSTTDVLSRLDAMVAASGSGNAGVAALRGLAEGAGAAGVPPSRLVIDPGIARGLDYYTGIVLETFLDALPSLGSVCSGGRYDNLAGLYTKQPLPGVGASLGIDRLLAGLEELGQGGTVETPAEVFLAYFDAAHLTDYLRIAAALRREGLAVEFFPEPKKLGQQLKLASKRGIPFALVLGGDEFKAGAAQLKNMAAETATTIEWRGDVAALGSAVVAHVVAHRHHG
jgi:histidyl-tRNA synthetase